MFWSDLINWCRSVVTSLFSHTGGVINREDCPAFNPEKESAVRLSVPSGRLEEIAAICEDQIDTSDIPEADERFFEDAVLIDRSS